jgi:MFS family permease
LEELPLKNKEFRLYLLARLFFIMAARMVAVAMVWHVSVLTKNTLSVGILGLSEVIPAIAFALYAGHVVDITDRRTLLVKFSILYFVTMLLLITVTSSSIEGRVDRQWLLWAIYGCIFLTGFIRSFTGPGFNALLAQIASREHLPKAVTYSSVTWQIASVIGPLLTGFLIAIVGITYTLAVVLVFTVIAIACLIGIKKKPVAKQPSERNTWESVKEGIHFVFKSKAILGALSLDLFAVFFGGATAMLSFYVTDILKVSAIWFGWLNAATSIGSIAVLLAISARPISGKQGKKLLYAVAAFGVCIIVFGISRNVWVSMVALCLSGIFDGISVVVRSTIMQLHVPDEMRGRVSSVNSIFINSSNELGQFESGVAAKVMGTVPSVVFGGCMTLLVVIVTWFKAPSLKKMEY